MIALFLPFLLLCSEGAPGSAPNALLRSANVAGQAAAPAPRAPAPAQTEPLVPTHWLVLAPVDGRGRRPLRPDAVLARYVVGPGSPAPVAGEEVTGETGKATWEERDAGDDGRLAGRGLGTAYTTVDSPAARVVLARLRGASTLVVNGVAYAGDVYAYGWPTALVRLEAGTNRVFVSGVRGGFSLSLEEPPAPLFVGGWEALAPDAIVGQSTELDIDLPLWNATEDWLAAPTLEAEVGGQAVEVQALSGGGIEPLGVREYPVRVTLPAPPDAPGTLALTVRAGVPGIPPAGHDFSIPVRGPRDLQRRTFVSRIDGSVQELCLRPPTGESTGGEPMRLELSLHGAGVQAWNQASSYAPRPDFWTVAATNRRPFGFDWQDWGRTDAYEVLDQALAISGVSRRFVYLGGHSMGGHGTWHLAANDPDGFAAIAPSAGWRSFDTYGSRPDTPLSALWKSADAASDTEALVDNLVQIPTFILHGGADDNVPVAEAQAMYDLLVAHGAKPFFHVEPGKGHWWDSGAGPGVDCLTWPGFYALFRDHLIAATPRTVRFTTVHPGVDSDDHWVSVLQVQSYGLPAHVEARWDPEAKRVEVTTENVRRLVVRVPGWSTPEALAVDGTELEWPAAGLSLLHTGDTWAIEVPRPGTPGTVPWPPEKTPAAGGPLKQAFGQHFRLVVPTGGTPEENEAALRAARYHQEVWSYRGNGDAEIVRDADLVAAYQEGAPGPAGDSRDPVAGEHANLILLGNADTNRLWPLVVSEEAPLAVHRGAVRVGDARYAGEDLACLAVLPQKTVPDALVGLLATTGASAELLAPAENLFISGAGFPDYIVFGTDMLTRADAGVRAAGWLDARWALQSRMQVPATH